MAVAETSAPQLVRGVDENEDHARRRRGRKGKRPAKRKRARESAVQFTTAPVLLREAGLERKGGLFECVVLVEGPGNPTDRNAYSAEALRQAVAEGLFEGLACHADHPTASEERERPERSVRTIAGHFREARFVPGGPGKPAEVRAKFKPIDGPGYEWVTSLIESALHSVPGRPLIGISIDGHGDAPDTAEINGRKYNLVRRILHLGSADIVTRAGAGGRFVKRLQESMRGAPAAGGSPASVSLPRLQKRLRKAIGRLEAALADEDEDKVREAFVSIREASSALVELPAADPTTDDQTAELARLQDQVRKEQRRRKLAEAKAAKATATARTAKRARQASTLLREAQVPPEIARIWLDELADCAGKAAMVSLLDRRQAQRREEIAELRESIVGPAVVEGAGPRAPIPFPSTPAGPSLLDRMGIEPHEVS